MPTTSQRGWPQLLVRLPPDVKTWLAAQAKRNSASQNSEIVRSVRDRMDSEKNPETTTVAKQTA